MPNKDELLQLVEENNVEGVNSSNNKQELTDALVAAGVDVEANENVSNNEEPVENVEEDVETEAEVEETVEEEEEETPAEGTLKNGKVLVRYVGKNPTYVLGKEKFTAQKPFSIVDEARANRMPAESFRRANKQEVEDFYNR